MEISPKKRLKIISLCESLVSRYVVGAFDVLSTHLSQVEGVWGVNKSRWCQFELSERLVFLSCYQFDSSLIRQSKVRWWQVSVWSDIGISIKHQSNIDQNNCRDPVNPFLLSSKFPFAILNLFVLNYYKFLWAFEKTHKTENYLNCCHKRSCFRSPTSNNSPSLTVKNLASIYLFC